MKLVDGVISQDSDCFAYGAVRVYRNFSISTQGAQASQSGAVDIYDMEKIQRTLEFGQNKVIAMALLCGCDYCPAGIDGVGRDGVMKVFRKYKETEVLDRLRSWRKDAETYKTLELRVDDKNVCTNCGHIGNVKAHSKAGCGMCCSNRSCNETSWKEERLLIKTELALRKKALTNPDFPSEEIIKEFLNEPENVPKLNSTWKPPNIVKFVRQIAPLLQWTEIYSFQKFFPILARWQICNDARLRSTIISEENSYITPLKVIKKRTIKGIPSIQILWKDQKGLFNGIVPEDEIPAEYGSFDKLLSTAEPLFLVETAYPDILEDFYSQNPNKNAVKSKKSNKKLNAFENLDDLVAETDKIASQTKVKRPKKCKKQVESKNVQTIDKFLLNKNDGNIKKSPTMMKHQIYSIAHRNIQIAQSSTPIMKSLPFELESDSENDSIDVSAIINDIVGKPQPERRLSKYTGRVLKYESATTNITQDDLNVHNTENQNRMTKNINMRKSLIRKFSHDDSFDILMKVTKDCLGYFESHGNKKQH